MCVYLLSLAKIPFIPIILTNTRACHNVKEVDDGLALMTGYVKVMQCMYVHNVINL